MTRSLAQLQQQLHDEREVRFKAARDLREIAGRLGANAGAANAVGTAIMSRTASDLWKVAKRLESVEGRGR